MSAETSHATPAQAGDKTPPKGLGAMAGAMFLMATSAIGPGFLTQTSVFTVQMGASFAFAIMLSILVDIAIQLNVWRVLCVTGMRANTLGNTVLPGLGWVLAVFVFIGGAVFNIGNIAGSGLGINAMLGIDSRIGGVIAANREVTVEMAEQVAEIFTEVIVAPGFADDPAKFDLAVLFARITFPYLMLISLTAFTSGVLNSYGYFAVPGFTPVLLNVCMIMSALFLTPYFDQPIMALAWGQRGPCPPWRTGGDRAAWRSTGPGP